MPHPGIRLRVETPSGIVLEGDSDWLHYAAKWSHGIDEGEWHEVLQHQVDGKVLIKLLLQPVMLEDEPEVPDYIPDDALTGLSRAGACNFTPNLAPPPLLMFIYPEGAPS